MKASARGTTKPEPTSAELAVRETQNRVQLALAMQAGEQGEVYCTFLHFFHLTAVLNQRAGEFARGPGKLARGQGNSLEGPRTTRGGGTCRRLLRLPLLHEWLAVVVLHEWLAVVDTLSLNLCWLKFISVCFKFASSLLVHPTNVALLQVECSMYSNWFVVCTSNCEVVCTNISESRSRRHRKKCACLDVQTCRGSRRSGSP